jgi:tight adherence protein B
MDDFWLWWDERLTNENRIALAATAAGIAFLFAFLLLRTLWNWLSVVRGPEVAEESLLLPREPSGSLARFDAGFARMVERTGLGLSLAEATGWIAFFGAIGTLGFYLLLPEVWMAMIGMAAGVAFAVAALFAYSLRHRTLLQNQLPDALLMLARSLRAGLTIEQAVDMTGEQGPKPLAEEFRRCAAQIRLGLPSVLALENAARRLQLLDFNVLVSTVSLHARVGGNLPMLLDRLAIGARDRNEFRGYLRSATALARVSILGIAAATPLILLGYLYFQPDYASGFFQSQQGMLTIGFALGLEIIGGIWLYRLMRIEL